MTAIEHSIIATGLLALFFYFGKHVGKKNRVEDAIEHTLDMLEKGNFIKVKTLKNGEKELIALDKVS